MAKTPQERYAEAFRALLKAQKDVIQDASNPFSLNLPTNGGLPEEPFINKRNLTHLNRRSVRQPKTTADSPGCGISVPTS